VVAGTSMAVSPTEASAIPEVVTLNSGVQHADEEVGTALSDIAV